MTKEERAKTAQILTAYKRMWPTTKANDDTIMLYVDALDGFTFQQIAAAMKRLAQTSKFFPCPAEIIEAVDKLVARVQDTEQPTEGEAWAEAMRYVKRVSPCDHHTKWMWSHPAVEAAAKRFGIADLYELKTED